MAIIIGNNNNNNLPGTAAADTIIGRAGNDQLFGNGGNDRLNGGTQNDLLNGGSGLDTADYSNLIIGGTTYIGATAGVTVNLNLGGAQNTGGAGIDQLVSIEHLIGTNFNDTFTGNSVNNVLLGLGGNDTLNGGNGNDTLNGGTQNDLLNGGSGQDTADYSNGMTYIGATAGVTVNLNLAGAQNTGGAGIDQLVSIEYLIGTDFNDTFTGNSGANVLVGRGGNDRLNGGGGDDRLNGGSGNDILNGGTGSNTADYSTATAGVRVDLDGGAGQATGGAGIDTLLSIEHLIGSNFNDTLIVDGLENGRTLNGGNGNDYIEANHYDGILNGGGGNDTLFGGNGFGTLNGGTGNDHLTAYDGAVLNGGDGDDLLEVDQGFFHSILNGGAGADTLQGSGGGSGNDTFDYNAVSDSPAGAGRDTIVNFFVGEEVGRADQIDLRDIDANQTSSAPGNQTFIWGGPFTAGHLRYNTTTGILQGNTDSDAAAEFEIQLLGAPALVVGGADPHILL